VVVDKSDQVWAVSWRYSDDTRYLRDYKLLRYSESDQTWYPLASIADRVDAVTADPVRGVWIAWFDGLSYFDGTRQRTWPAPDFPDRMPTSLLVDEDGRVWMGTIQGGVWTMLPQARSTKNTDNARSRSIWHRFTITDKLESQLIMALAQGPDGRIYAAHAAGISVLDPSEGVENGRWVTLPGSNVKPKKWVNTLVFAQAGGGLWVSHYYHSSLWHYRDGRWTEYRLPLEFERRYYTGGHDYHRAVQSIGRLLVDEDGTLWVGTIKGLWRWPAAGDGGEARWQTFDSSTLTMRDVTTLAQDSRGRIWVGGEEGIAMWDGGR
jgi:ligand-binding sensor domain-containing protein